MNLRKLQLKSSVVKAQYAFLTASVITGVIAIVWISTVPARFANVSDPAETQELENFLVESENQLGTVVGAVDDVDASMREVNAPNLNSLNMSGSGEPNTTPSVPAQSGDIQLTSTTSVMQEKPATSTPKTEEPKVILIGTTTKNTP